jgi:hypothetical protein
MTKDAKVEVLLDGRVRSAAENDGRRLLFRFAPRDAKPWTYSLHSGGVKLEALSGGFTAAAAPRERTAKPTTAPPTTSAAIAAITVTSTWILLTFVRTAPGGAVE